MQTIKQYIAPETSVFTLSPEDRMMQDFMANSGDHDNPGSGAPVRLPEDN